MIVNAENAVLGRMLTHVAKKALMGEQVDVVNCELAIVSGGREEILHRFLSKKKRGVPMKGPFYSSNPEKFMKRIVRGMLPYKMSKGSEAFDRIKFYKGVPTQFKDKEMQTFGHKKLKVSVVTIAEICKFIGGR